MSVKTETETVIKRILPYLRRRGYVPELDIDFETPVKMPSRSSRGYVDLLVTLGKPKPSFVIEAKRSGKVLNESDRNQALAYGKELSVPFVVVTNGADIQCLNTETGQQILWDGKLTAKIPRKEQLAKVMRLMRATKSMTIVPLSDNVGLPFRPGLPLKQLNAIFTRCHNRIRNIEKNEENAFSDFSKILFLKLLEEKYEQGNFDLPYSYRFHELAEKKDSESDQVQTAIVSMIGAIRNLGYGAVLGDSLRLKQPKTFHFLVKELSSVSFEDSGLDSKGAAFEYFVRATLKGKRLGQYFTPRPLVDLMAGMIGRQTIIDSLLSGAKVRVVDPACGTGGFLVITMKMVLSQLDERYAKKNKNRALTADAYESVRRRIKQEVFFGADANEGVASAAKMNMIVAGDGHANIRAEDTLSSSSETWSFETPAYDFVLTNPPFGTSEFSSLSANDLSKYPVAATKGQNLFLQRMILATKPGGKVCTVIDDGVLNTESAEPLRRWILRNMRLLAVVSLPEETFKPNKINVKASVLLMERREYEDEPSDPEHHPVVFCRIDSLGYLGSGEPIRGFDFDALRSQLDEQLLDYTNTSRSGQHWSAFQVDSVEILNQSTCRWDLKYWEPGLRDRVRKLRDEGRRAIKDLNVLPTRRGKSPPAASYVDHADGHAIVVKAGSCISKFGELDVADADYIEKFVYDEMPDEIKLRRGDVLIASTGEGTLGKCCVYTLDAPAIADGHITIVRVDPKQMLPEFLCDYLRCGFGHQQILSYATGSTGLIELTPEDVNNIMIDGPTQKAQQRAMSRRLRKAEQNYRAQVEAAGQTLEGARAEFGEFGKNTR